MQTDYILNVKFTEQFIINLFNLTNNDTNNECKLAVVWNAPKAQSLFDINQFMFVFHIYTS